jgi:hypothetical protein
MFPYASVNESGKSAENLTPRLRSLRANAGTAKRMGKNNAEKQCDGNCPFLKLFAASLLR